MYRKVFGTLTVGSDWGDEPSIDGTELVDVQFKGGVLCKDTFTCKKQERTNK